MIIYYGFIWYLVFLFSLVIHEFAHAFIAMRLGDRTAYHNGQVTFNPLPHIRQEVFGTTIIPILSYLFTGWMFGWGSAPYDPHWAYLHPKKSAKMALAGPASNLLLVIIAALLIRAGIAAGIFQTAERISIVHLVQTAPESGLAGIAELVSILFSLNLILFVFNLIPVPPLDGSGILPLFLSDTAARRFMDFSNGSFRLFGIFIAWMLFDKLFPPVYRLFIHLLF